MQLHLSKIMFLLVSATSLCTLLRAQTTRMQITRAQITSVEAYATPGAVKGCTSDVKVITFTAYVTAARPCVVVYKWLRSDNAKDNNVNRIIFTAAGTKKVTTTWTMSVSQYDGWEALQIVQPNAVTSNKAQFSVYCCGGTGTVNCADNPYTITPGGESIMKGLQHLVAKDGTRNCNPKVLTYNTTMDPKYYVDGQGAGSITAMDYAAFYADVNEKALHLLFAAPPTPNRVYNYDYYGVCSPEHPVIFPASSENASFEVCLIPVDKYKAAPESVKKSYLQLKELGLATGDIASITNWYIEPKSGYLGSTDAYYDEPHKSCGLVVKVKLKTGEEILTYMRTSYDGDGDRTITWKMAAKCP